MFRRSVVAPDGATWTIRRHWVARDPRFKWLMHPRKLTGVADWIDVPVADGPGWFWIPLAILGLALLIFFAIPALIFLVELLLFLAIASLLVFVNSLFRRPWIVEALREQPVRQLMRWKVVGLWRSRRVISEIAQELELGHRTIEPLDAERLDERSP